MFPIFIEVGLYSGGGRIYQGRAYIRDFNPVKYLGERTCGGGAYILIYWRYIKEILRNLILII